MARSGVSEVASARGIHCRSLRAGVVTLLLLGLLVTASGCSGPGSLDPSGSPTPSPTSAPPTPSEWGAYGDRSGACTAVAGDVVALALIPNNLGLVDSAGLDGIEQQIQGLSDAAPAGLIPAYQQILALTRSYGQELDAYEAEVAASASASPSSPGASSPGGSSPAPDDPAYTGTPKKTPGAADDSGSGSGTGSGSSSGVQPGDIPGDDSGAFTSPTPDPGPTRPVFEKALFEVQVDGIKQWLGETCAG